MILRSVSRSQAVTKICKFSFQVMKYHRNYWPCISAHYLFFFHQQLTICMIGKFCCKRCILSSGGFKVISNRAKFGEDKFCKIHTSGCQNFKQIRSLFNFQNFPFHGSCHQFLPSFIPFFKCPISTLKIMIISKMKMTSAYHNMSCTR